MQRNGLGIVLAVGVVAAAVAFSARSLRRTSTAEMCDVCQRPVHAHSKTVALLGGRRDVFCCPACALTAQRQSGRPLKWAALTDYETGRRLSPEQAVLVRGSDVNPCDNVHVLRDATGQPSAEQFDRCSPSILAFAGRDAAARFMAAHGGRLVTVSELR